MSPKYFIPALLLIAGFMLWNEPALAEDPPPGSGSEVVESNAVEEAQVIASPELLPLPEPETSKPAEPVTPETPFFVKKITLEGNTFIPDDEVQKILALYEGRQVTFQDLKEACGQIELLARQHGYLGICFPPPQTIQDGQVTLKLNISRMGDLHFDGMRYTSVEKLRSLWTIPKGEPLRYPELQAVLRKFQGPDRVVRVVLRPGTEPESTDIYLNVQDRSPVHWRFSADNESTELLDKNKGAAVFRHNNLLGADDVFILGTSFGKDFGAVFSQYLLPVNSHGTKLLVNSSAAQVNPKKEFEPQHINGTSQTLGASVLQNMFATESASLDLSLGLNAKEKKTKTLSVMSVRDRLRTIAFGTDFQTLDGSGRWKFGQSLEDGWTVGDEGLLSRQADDSFFIYHYSAERQQTLPGNTRLVLNTHGQVSDDRLTPQMQVFLGGADTVRGYPESDYGADRAFVSNAEYWIPAFFLPSDWKLPNANELLKEAVHLVPFFDYGWGMLNEVIVSELPSRTLMGTGIGINLKLWDYASTRLQWGFPLGEDPLTEDRKSQFYYTVQMNF